MTREDAQELKPCPFCGDAPLFTDKGNPLTATRGTTVKCGGCGFTKTVKAIQFTLEWTRAQAIAAWNRRAE